VPFNLDVYCHHGAMARTVADAALFENVLAGPHPLDHTSLRPKLEIPAQLEGVEGLRVALSPGLGAWALDPEVDANTRAAAEALREAGAIVEEVDLKISKEDVDLALALHFNLIFAGWIGSMLDEHRDLMCAYAIDFAETMARRSEGHSVFDGLMAEARVHEPLGLLLEEYDALVCATMGTRGLAAGDDYVGHGVEVGGQQLDHYFDSILTPVFNIASRCPVLAVPSGLADNGAPTGIQIVGRTYDDVTVFRLGAALEQVRPWLDAPERRPMAEAVPA
jgi:Asp-tRNA(Asn)/Glu-tRNA(Gln) amidotransferase A subunit family amidase